MLGGKAVGKKAVGQGKERNMKHSWNSTNNQHGGA